MLEGYRMSRAAIMLVLAAATPASAQMAADPEWPCIQSRVPELSLVQMWSGPIPTETSAPDRDMTELARILAPRRLSLEDLDAAVQTAIRDVPVEARPEWLAELFAAILVRINSERGAVMSGIGRYATGQQALSDRVDAMETDLAALEGVEDSKRDMDRIEELQDRLEWERRVFKDRAQSLTYVCEVPVLLEKRAFAIGRTLSGML
jgi:hypothetical protein